MELEELATTASEDELAARTVAAKTQSVRAFTRKRPVRKPWPDDIERERGYRGPEELCLLRRIAFKCFARRCFDLRPANWTIFG
ncbi:hypothetical protein SAMN05216525_1113 [Bradyrhizobium sp. Gha]|nr:hypothetical protein SAMN05216525_1113 [Bradyrhizobium sp. Gha]